MPKNTIPTVLALVSGLGIGFGFQQGPHPEYRMLHVEYFNPEAKDLKDRKVLSCGYVSIDANGNVVKYGTHTRFHRNGQKEVEVNFKDGKEDGPFVTWDRKGQKVSEGTNQDGRQHGPFVTWHNYGEKASEGTYYYGYLHSKVLSWHANGQKEFEVTVQDGEIVTLQDGSIQGTIVAWSDKGQKASERTFKDGKPDGPFVFWHENGKKKFEGTFKNGEPVGLHREWDESGKLIKEENHGDK